MNSNNFLKRIALLESVIFIQISGYLQQVVIFQKTILSQTVYFFEQLLLSPFVLLLALVCPFGVYVAHQYMHRY